MKNIENYNFELPENLIAQSPLKDRDTSRLLVVDKTSHTIEHHHFYDIIDYLNKDDVLVLNNSRVIPARLIGSKLDTGGKVEILMLKEVASNQWSCLCKPARKIKEGSIITFGDGLLLATAIKCEEEGIRIFEFKYTGILIEILEKLGTMPLPPYIKEQLIDQERYQTIYSKVNGSAAAPTAGLHFSPDLISKIKEKGIKIAYVTLHVGLGTFRPVSVSNIDDHKMHSEYYELDDTNAKIINEAKTNNSKIFSVGTTSTRTLETIALKGLPLKACTGFSEIFIYPGFNFKVVDAQITNFHLPKSTLMMLVSAFASNELIMKAYQEAIDKEYRFFSFGDSMLLK